MTKTINFTTIIVSSDATAWPSSEISCLDDDDTEDSSGDEDFSLISNPKPLRLETMLQHDKKELLKISEQHSSIIDSNLEGDL